MVFSQEFNTKHFMQNIISLRVYHKTSFTKYNTRLIILQNISCKILFSLNFNIKQPLQTIITGRNQYKALRANCYKQENLIRHI
ncbi:MAG: hypothetical protein CSB06_00920 [Bacteroidia bacterium]|nr:MAG: hypothetical protein CSB06_00920 [Bacteroidia bacterium]